MVTLPQIESYDGSAFSLLALPLPLAALVLALLTQRSRPRRLEEASIPNHKLQNNA
jgi:hypothetical protein